MLYDDVHIVLLSPPRCSGEVRLRNINCLHPLALAYAKVAIRERERYRGLRDNASADGRLQHHRDDKRTGQAHADHADTGAWLSAAEFACQCTQPVTDWRGDIGAQLRKFLADTKLQIVRARRPVHRLAK
ncbi:hypothetical protein D3C72_1743220 [compost metagenome]